MRVDVVDAILMSADVGLQMLMLLLQSLDARQIAAAVFRRQGGLDFLNPSGDVLDIASKELLLKCLLQFLCFVGRDGGQLLPQRTQVVNARLDFCRRKVISFYQRLANLQKRYISG